MIGIPITLGSLLGVAFAPILLRQVVYYVMTWNDAAIQNRAVERLTIRAFRAVAEAELSYVESQDQGRLLGAMTGQLTRCGTALIHLIKLVSTAVIITVYTVILMMLSWPLAVIAVISMAGVSLMVRRILVKTRAYGKQVTQAAVSVASFIGYGIPALLRKLRASRHRDAGSAQASAPDNRAARG